MLFYCRIVYYKIGFCETSVTLEFWMFTPSFLHPGMLEPGTIPVMVDPYRVSGVVFAKCWLRRCSTMVHIFHRHPNAASIRPMASEEPSELQANDETQNSHQGSRSDLGLPLHSIYS